MITQFLNRLSSWFKGSRKPDSDPDRQTDYTFFPAEGDLARFSFSKKRDFFSGGDPKPRVFKPEKHPATGVLETSVCGLAGVSDARLWLLGRTIRQDKKQAEGAVQLPISATQDAGLRCDPEPTEFPEHGVILGWSEEKDRQLSEQQELVSRVVEVKFPPDYGAAH